MHIAIFGCGQLAQMVAQAGKALGLQFSFIAVPGEDTVCVDDLGEVVILHPDLGAEKLFHILGKPDVFTVEKEMVDTQLLDDLQKFASVYPCSQAVHVTQNRIREKRFLLEQGIATTNFEIVTSREQLYQLPKQIAYPIYVKSAEAGYDGYHQWQIHDKDGLEQETLLQAIDQGIEIIAEQRVNYIRELSIIAARDRQGEMAVYPVMENRHENGVLLATMAPAPKLKAEIEQTALVAIKRVMVALNYIGVLTIEFFETEQGLVANELAPRVHNSGHWTIEGSQCSQFENHCRAISNLPLGATEMPTKAGLVNILGVQSNADQFFGEEVFYHTYGKKERPGRKLGHVTVCTKTQSALIEKLNSVIYALYGSHYSPIIA